MATSQTQTIPKEQFLVMATNLLHRNVLEMPRTQAKNVFNDMTKGRIIHLTTVQMEDKSTVQFDVALDHTEFKGSINFRAFRTSLSLLLANLVKVLTEKTEITVFSAENDADVMIFGVVAATEEDGQSNVMVLGADAGHGQTSVVLRLMYIDHSQFADHQSSAAVDEEQEKTA